MNINKITSLEDFQKRFGIDTAKCIEAIQNTEPQTPPNRAQLIVELMSSKNKSNLSTPRPSSNLTNPQV
jgi:hypothetical protein